MAVSIQFQQRLQYVDADGRFNNEAIRALNSLASQISDIAKLFDITGEQAVALVGIGTAPVIMQASSTAFVNERVLAASTPIAITDAGPGGLITVYFNGYTDNVPEGVTNLYFTQARARLSINGSATISYNNSTGIISLSAANVAAALGYTPYDASNPAGYVTGGGAQSLNIRTITATATPTATDYTLLCDASAGPIVVNLAAASGQNKRILNIKKIDATANAVTIDPSGVELIDGAATQIITAQWDSLMVQCNGAAWFRL